MGASNEWVDPFYYDRHFSKQLANVVELISSKVPTSISVFPSSINSKLAEELLKHIQKDIETAANNFNKLGKCSKFYQPRSIRKPQRYEDTGLVRKSREKHEKQIKNPFKSSKKRGRKHDDDWISGCGNDENLVLYYLFYYISFIVDKVRFSTLQRDSKGALLPPRTNLRILAKSSNIASYILLLVVIYYLMFM